MAKILIKYKVTDSKNQIVGAGLLSSTGSPFDYNCTPNSDPKFLIDTNELDITYLCRRALALGLKAGPIFPCEFKFESDPSPWGLTKFMVIYTLEIKRDNLIEARWAYNYINYALKSPALVLGHI